MADFPFHCADPSGWDPDEDELHRERDRVLPAVEIWFSAKPTEAEWTAVARILVEHDAGPTSQWSRPEVSGAFLRVWPSARTPEGVVARAKTLLASVARVAPIREALLLVPCVPTPKLDAGPAWDKGWRVRPVDRQLPNPGGCPPMDAVFFERQRADIESRMWIAEITGKPQNIESLDAAIRAAGVEYPDRDGTRHQLVEIIRTEQDHGTDWASHSVLGLLADGRWAWVLTGKPLKRGKKRGPARPRNLLLFGPRRRDFERALAKGLEKHGLEASLPIDEMLRAEVDAFIEGAPLHPNVFGWLEREPLAREPRVQEALRARADDPYMKGDIARVIAATRGD